MKQKRLYIISGPSGSGKSSWVQKRIAEFGGNWISRDLIRFSLVDEGEDYFSKEKEVLKEFYNSINTYLGHDIYHKDIYVDATHLTPRARKELFRNINYGQAAEIIGVSFEIPVDVALQRNSGRIGRSHVPDTVIKRMCNQFIPPKFEEGYTSIIHINELGEERVENLNG